MAKWNPFKKREKSLGEVLTEQNRSKDVYLEKEQSRSILQRSSQFFKNTFLGIFSSEQINEEVREQIEEGFIRLDFGPFLSSKLSKDIASNMGSVPLKDSIKKSLIEAYGDFDVELNFQEGKTNVFLIVGANGSGKTTSIAKLAAKYKGAGNKVLIVAADTFRAGAVDQLKNWAFKLSVDIVLPVRHKEDPSALIFRALEKNKEKHYDLIICDTSGKQHTNQNLLQELNKIYKTIRKFDETQPHETLLIVDSTIGQSSFLQAKSFLDHANVTGIILSKMDSLTRGGVVFAIKDQFKVPVKLIGTGEKIEDLHPFELEDLIDVWLEDFVIEN